jgi:hypothetical protein
MSETPWAFPQGTSAPAGWFPDPAMPSTLRWWNGMNWTGYTAPSVPPTDSFGGYPGTQKTNGMAIASFVCSMAGILLLGLPCLVGVGLGIASLRQIERSGGNQGGRGLALAGIWVGAIFTAIFVVVVIIGILTPSTCNTGFGC